LVVTSISLHQWMSSPTRLQLPAELVLLFRVAAMSDGLGDRLDPDFRLFAFAAPYPRQFWLERNSTSAMAKRLAHSTQDSAELGIDLPQRAARLVSQLIWRNDCQDTATSPPFGASGTEMMDAAGNAPDVMATRGQSDMFGYPHDRLVRRERRSSRVERGRKGLLIAEPRMLLARVRRVPRDVRASASAVHQREAPAPAGELTGDGHGGHGGALAARVEAPPATVQTALSGGGTLAYQAG
jgi:hypothetical protein